MSELKPCPFCGGTKICTEKGINLNNYCDNCSAESNVEHWNTRPIEDALHARIAELEATVEIHTDISNAYEKRISEIVSLSNKANAKLQARIAELEAEQRWIPVSERLPEPYTRVLACIKGGYMEVDYMYSEPIVDVGIADFNSLDNVTHWMPLPKFPEVQESEATSCKFCGSNKSDIRMNSIVCTSCGRKIGNIAPPEVQE